MLWLHALNRNAFNKCLNCSRLWHCSDSSTAITILYKHKTFLPRLEHRQQVNNHRHTAARCTSSQLRCYATTVDCRAVSASGTSMQRSPTRPLSLKTHNNCCYCRCYSYLEQSTLHRRHCTVIGSLHEMSKNSFTPLLFSCKTLCNKSL